LRSHGWSFISAATAEYKKSAVKYNGLASGGHDEEESVRKEERKERRK